MLQPLQTAGEFAANSGEFNRQAPGDFVGAQAGAYGEMAGRCARR
jgi:hypothetical protein